MSGKNIFDQHLEVQDKSLFKDKDVLRIGYTPSVIFHRDKEINHLASMLSDALRGQTPSNIFICGKPGTGKTATTKYIGSQLLNKKDQLNRSLSHNVNSLLLPQILQESVEINDRNNGTFDNINSNPTSAYEQYSTFLNRIFNTGDFLGHDLKRSISTNVEFIYLNCKHVDTKYRVLTQITNSLSSESNEPLPPTGLTTDMVIEQMIKHLEEFRGVVIIVLDEVDNLIKKSGDNTLHILSRMNEELELSSTSLVCISNDANVLGNVHAAVLSSLALDINVFKPYNAEQLRDILSFRAAKAFNRSVCPESVINLCSAFAARDNGDARRALSLLMVAGEIAEKSGYRALMEKHVRKAQDKIETDSVQELVSSLPIHCKMTLASILMQHELGNRITTGSVYESYNQICRSKGISNLTKRRVSDFISELGSVGLIDASLISHGAYGRTRQIKLAACDETIRDTFHKDEELNGIIDNNMRSALSKNIFGRNHQTRLL